MSFEVQFKGGEPGKLDPQVAAFLSDLPPDDTPVSAQTVDDIRNSPSPILAYHPVPAPVAVEEIGVPVRDGRELRVRVYRKDKTTIAPPLLFIHGGCWVFCSIDTHDALCRQLCIDSGFTVFSVDYRLAPENKFPAGLNDCFDVAQWITENSDTVRVTNHDLLIGGDSAGGNLSTAVTLMAKRSGLFKVRGQLLFYPICDVSKSDRVSYAEYAEGYFLTREMMQLASGHYVSSKQELQNPLVSPLHADDLADMPRTLIQTAEFDILRDEAEDYAVKLGALGVEVSCVRYNGLIHAYAAMTGEVNLAREAVRDAATFLKSFNR